MYILYSSSVLGCTGYSGSVMDKVGLLWIKWVCNGYSGSVMDIVGV